MGTGVSFTEAPMCVVEYSSDFSSDASIEVIEDSKFKKHDFFDDLCKFMKASEPSYGTLGADKKPPWKSIYGPGKFFDSVDKVDMELVLPVIHLLQQEDSGVSHFFTSINPMTHSKRLAMFMAYDWGGEGMPGVEWEKDYTVKKQHARLKITVANFQNFGGCVGK